MKKPLNFIFYSMERAFDFNTLSSGYQAVLDIILDIIMRMQNQTQRSFDFNLPGIVLIDEIETHLHLELQKNIMPFLTTIFPNIQFIVTSHSPFILNSIRNVVIYDLEKICWWKTDWIMCHMMVLLKDILELISCLMH